MKCAVASPAECGHENGVLAEPGLLEHTAERVNRRENLILFDWDDTLCPSTYLTHEWRIRDDTSSVPPQLEEHLRPVEDAGIRAIYAAMRVGTVVIVTNAEHGWVKLSSEKYLPRLARLLEKYEVPVVSARTRFEASAPDSPVDWKRLSFEEQLVQVEQVSRIKNAVVVGDDECERMAGYAVRAERPQLQLKTIKFISRPRPCDIVVQLKLLSQIVKDVCEDASRSLDLNLVV